MSIGSELFRFFTSLRLSENIPDSIEVLNPYLQSEVITINEIFYNKYYNDSNSRIMLLGINPGRIGAGVTGIVFSDPVTLEQNLKIKNNFPKKPELSASFINKAIDAYGGPTKFFNSFMLTAVSPLGFIKEGVNINYYDDKSLLKATTTFIKSTLVQQFEITGKIPVCGCIGQGANYKFLKELNQELKLFNQIIPLPHPRWIMQYRRKDLAKQLEQYTKKLKLILALSGI